MLRRGSVIVRTLSVLLMMVAAPVLLLADKPADPDPPQLPPGLGQYVMVLWESGTPFPNDPSKTMKVTEPDIASLGGQLISKSANRRVIRLPLAAAKKLRQHPSVAYLQRVWMGESFDHWDETYSTDPASTTSSAGPSRHKTEDDTNLQWGPKSYSYDGSGNITQIGPDQYVYDSAGRLIEAVVSGKVERYSYDAFGNLIQKGVDGANPVAIPVDGQSNRMLGASYDVAGNVQNGKSDGSRPYLYDSLNMVTRIRPVGTDRRYIYDANDEQIGMLYPTGGPTTETSRWTFRDFDGHVIREYRAEAFDNSQGGNWIWEQDSFYGEGMLLGGETQQFGFNDNGTTTTWGGRRHYHLDHLGSVRMVTDDSGRSIDEHDYYPFGTTMTRTYQDQFNWADPHIDSARFAGHRRDFLGLLNVDDTDYLDNMHARYYDPNLGRFLTADPAISASSLKSPQQWNRYAYVRNSPLNATDPAGEWLRFIGPNHQMVADDVNSGLSGWQLNVDESGLASLVQTDAKATETPEQAALREELQLIIDDDKAGVNIVLGVGGIVNMVGGEFRKQAIDPDGISMFAPPNRCHAVLSSGTKSLSSMPSRYSRAMTPDLGTLASLTNMRSVSRRDFPAGSGLGRVELIQIATAPTSAKLPVTTKMAQQLMCASYLAGPAISLA